MPDAFAAKQLLDLRAHWLRVVACKIDRARLVEEVPQLMARGERAIEQRARIAELAPAQRELALERDGEWQLGRDAQCLVVERGRTDQLAAAHEEPSPQRAQAG